MENKLLSGLQNATNFTLTQNGAVTHRTTLNGVMDLFALGGAYRNRSNADCINLFLRAFEEDETLALKCLFYLRDVRGGQGERRFFRVVMQYMAYHYPDAVRRNLKYVPEFGRWDDLYAFVDTPLEKDVFDLMYHQLALDVSCKTPSLLAKWLKSENTSSAASRSLATKTREAFHMTSREYRKTLSALRERIRVVERLMSENRWDEIEFDKIPSKAGLIYRNAFARRDILKEKYAKFARSKENKVNAAALTPYEIAHKAFYECRHMSYDAPERLMLQKYWDNLPDYYNGREENGIAVVDVSGSMDGTPMEAAVSLGAYIADKAHGPFAGHFITFSHSPELVKFEGIDITDKLDRCRDANWSMNTNLEATFDLLLSTALKTNCRPEDMPTRIYIFSDMEFNSAVDFGPVTERVTSGFFSFGRTSWVSSFHAHSIGEINTLMEGIAQKWKRYGYQLPSVIFWNLNAMQDNIPAIGPGFSYVSGLSPSMIETILSGKDGFDLVLEKLNSERYACIK